MTKKAQAISLGKAPTLVLLITLAIMIAGASGIALSSFKESACGNAGYYWDGIQCEHNSTNNLPAGDYAVNATASGESALDNLSNQIPTVGTVIGVALIVVVVVGAFAFFIGRGGAL